jgi:hypothetical protein
MGRPGREGKQAKAKPDQTGPDKTKPPGPTGLESDQSRRERGTRKARVTGHAPQGAGWWWVVGGDDQSRNESGNGGV